MALRCTLKTVAELAAMACIGMLLIGDVGFTQEPDTSRTEKIPDVVMKSLSEKFPKADIRTWTRESEDDVVIYDIEFFSEDRKFEADIREDGTIENWERETTMKKLPTIVLKTVDSKYPKPNFHEIMEIMTIMDGKDILEGYEIVLEISDGEYVEMTVAQDGEIMEEDSADEE